MIVYIKIRQKRVNSPIGYYNHLMVVNETVVDVDKYGNGNIITYELANGQEN
jgi:hypothetical protein